ncbi:16S rRNA (guanine966-N2)-methyltransferase [Rubritalea squalenifaciens DSM 18772]|uniref:16S rRNA (Guanine966-N2)-methyltransferase n=1 Tax=Rubritalea squalenifaciens DSM 18772 TaxID=1123071 RepID=A0A1M6PD72_9BACT|nr:16S rRNA (guanine(966)-N(2))-methyltransferase RsmD [Rubritalea squalenifaciens]SHK05867.1 16S rRNA (guanine966-N2)-methyltransferase [Rubritalea squalenifaciens DSM 18772]
MRIIAGTAGRRNIKVPRAVVRPTTDRTREALFSILSPRIEGARVLDLFAGSGALGMEALSRGAKSCVFVDGDRACTKVIQENLRTLNLGGGSVLQADAVQYCKRVQGDFDLVFADPPYKKTAADRDFVMELMSEVALQQAVAESGLLVVEMDAGVNFVCPEGWSELDARKYGGCAVYIFEREDSV